MNTEYSPLPAAHLQRTAHNYTPDEWHAARAAVITSTDCAALFGLSPYKTKFELWHEKRTRARPEFAPNERMKWGLRLERAIADGAAESRGWTIIDDHGFIELDGLRIGSSFDFLGSDEPGADLFHVECKNVDWLAFRNGWTVTPDFIEAPAHIELQAQHQMLVSGRERLFIVVLVGGNDVRVIERRADGPTQSAILAACADFWQSIADDNAPDPVYPDDAAAVIGMHQFAEPGKLLTAHGDEEIATLIRRHAELKSTEKNIGEQLDEIKARIFSIACDAEKIIVPGYTVSCSMTAPTPPKTITAEMVGQSFDGRSGFRNLRITRKPTTAATTATEPTK